MKKNKQKMIDTLKIRELHTSRMTVYEIAEAMGIDVSRVLFELEYMGYTPIYEHDEPEPCSFMRK